MSAPVHGLHVVGTGDRLELDAGHRLGVVCGEPPRMRPHDGAVVDDQRRLDELDGATRAGRAHLDPARSRRDHAEDVEGDPGELHALARLVQVDLVGEDAADRRHVLLVVAPRALHVDGRRVETRAEPAVEGRGVAVEREDGAVTGVAGHATTLGRRCVVPCGATAGPVGEAEPEVDHADEARGELVDGAGWQVAQRPLEREHRHAVHGRPGEQLGSRAFVRRT